VRLTRDGWFAVLLVWAAVSGSLLGNGQAHHVVPLIVAGAVMSAAFWGVLAYWAVARRRRRRDG
jgi:threonine/homoserine/homoserine lactone efflux protein